MALRRLEARYSEDFARRQKTANIHADHHFHKSTNHQRDSMSCLMNFVASTVGICMSRRTHPRSIEHPPPIVQDSPLLHLPRELRDQIFSYLLVEPNKVKLIYNSKADNGYAKATRSSSKYGQERTGKRFGPSPGIEVSGLTDCYQHLMTLAQLCRQTRDEAQEANPEAPAHVVSAFPLDPFSVQP